MKRSLRNESRKVIVLIREEDDIQPDGYFRTWSDLVLVDGKRYSLSTYTSDRLPRVIGVDPIPMITSFDQLAPLEAQRAIEKMGSL